MFRKKFYYGTGTDHVVMLTQLQADSLLNLRVYEVDEREDGTYCRVDFVGPGNMKAYDEAATILNEYTATHDVLYTQDDLDAGIPVLRPVK